KRQHDPHIGWNCQVAERSQHKYCKAQCHQRRWPFEQNNSRVIQFPAASRRNLTEKKSSLPASVVPHQRAKTLNVLSCWNRNANVDSSPNWLFDLLTPMRERRGQLAIVNGEMGNMEE